MKEEITTEKTIETLIEWFNSEGLSMEQTEKGIDITIEAVFEKQCNTGPLTSRIKVLLDSEQKLVYLSIRDNSGTSPFDIEYLIHLMNELNVINLSGHWVISHRLRLIQYRDTLLVKGAGSEKLIRPFLSNAFNTWKDLYPEVKEALRTKKDPKALLKEYEEKWIN